MTPFFNRCPCESDLVQIPVTEDIDSSRALIHAHEFSWSLVFIQAVNFFWGNACVKRPNTFDKPLYFFMRQNNTASISDVVKVVW